jgi:hypothetical protein
MRVGSLLALVLIVYAAFATRTYYWDGVLDALNIESVAGGETSPAVLFHPNHLLYSALGYVLYRAAGSSLRAITVLQILNILASAATASLLYTIAKRITKSDLTALFCLILFAFGATWWKFSIDADPYIISVLLLLAAFWFATESPPRIWRAAICHTLAMLFHELAIFAYPAILAAILLQSTTKKARDCALYTLTTAGSVAAAYWVCYSQSDHRMYPTLFTWLTSYASDSSFTRSLRELVNPYLTSYLKLFVGGRFSLIRDYFSAVSGLALAICVASLASTVVLFRRDGASAYPDRRQRILLWIWLTPYAIFLACWDPGSAFHKLFVWPPIVLLIGAYVGRKKASIAIAIAIAAWNFGAFIYPHSHTSADPVLVLAEKIDRELPKNAVIYYSAFSPDDWYLDYFAPGRKWIKLTSVSDLTSTPGPVCLDTTALATYKPAIDSGPKWHLINKQHNIRLECLKAR